MTGERADGKDAGTVHSAMLRFRIPLIREGLMNILNHPEVSGRSKEKLKADRGLLAWLKKTLRGSWNGSIPPKTQKFQRLSDSAVESTDSKAGSPLPVTPETVLSSLHYYRSLRLYGQQDQALISLWALLRASGVIVTACVLASELSTA